MNHMKNIQNDHIFFLSDLTGIPVCNQGKKIGKLDDLLIVEHEKVAEVTHVIVSRPFGYKSLMVPLARIDELKRDGIELSLQNLEAFEAEPEDNQVLLKDHILDKKVIDLDGNEIDVVYDVKLLLRNARLYATDVDFSRYGLLKRLGLRYVAQFVYHLAEMFKKETIPWTYVQRLPEKIGSFKGNVQLKILKEALPDIHPVDLADILEELSEEQRLAIFNELETDQASDTLEEMEPRVQRILISSMNKERVADLIDEMTPAQAADVLSVLPTDQAEEILDLMEHDETEKIEALLENQVNTITNLTTNAYIRFLPDVHTDLVIAAYRTVSQESDVLDYVFVVDHDNKLKGVVSLPELLMAKQSTPLSEIMTTQVISLDCNDSIADAEEKFKRYGFSALPVLDEEDTIHGIVPYRDIMQLEHNYS
ncbi:CBS domain-containing protein [Geobacter pelophilus]|uniref:CBS domain-containing protein n=1 Tax=Geoanaerobacter pelophilus TaxID=60036 RepID=A0AAW4L4Q0_9BACT|nr:CBS domain-containing protein [Geoanaerobacter pelophilus]MBT0663565.1 CBS domain-containing protein [Geoanaerobacter pelophilus]MDD2539953.1 CBS domain-containing protein [Desulfuromonadaceae bacterium]NTV49174.1 magnesium transporter [Geobacteraceae bacterium]NTW79325.1 magnesium transporter [Geobacteraceae bacterium]